MNAPSTSLPHSPASTDRRQFLKGISYAAASAAIIPAFAGLSASPVAASETDKLSASAELRKKRSFALRQYAAAIQYRMPVPIQTPNQDELIYRSRIGNFSKGLPHNDLGEVDSVAYSRLLTACSTGRHEDFEAIPMGGSVKLANPQASSAFQLEGGDTPCFAAPAFSAFASEQIAGEMVELYWHALVRNVPFSQYGHEPQTQAAMSDLKRFAQFSQVNVDTLFRAGLPGDHVGPLVSQFLWQDIPCGALTIQQRCRVPDANNVHMTDYAEWLAVQRGIAPTSKTTYDNTTRYIRNAHDLAEWVHRDYSYQAFQNAALILLGMNAARDANPYAQSKTQSGFITFGAVHILDMLAKVTSAALKACWYQKWQVHRALRPEVFSGRVHNHIRGAARYPIHTNLLNSKALDAIHSRYGSYLLPQVYPEGSPTHPSYPAGHAAIAGACVTVLKAFFDEDFVLPQAFVPSEDGLSLQPYQAQALTVGSELNKLAGNIALARDYAGVHYRQDGIHGILLGEQVALNLLSESKLLTNERNAIYKLTKYDGQTVSF